jgi:hypothetical protein
MVRSTERPLHLGIAFRRAASSPPREVRAPPWHDVNRNGPNLHHQTDITFMSRTRAVRPILLFPLACLRPLSQHGPPARSSRGN